MRAVLTIAGSDSSAGAGIQADLKTFAAHGLYGTSAITAITAQNTQGVVAMSALAADLVTLQIEAIVGDIELHATKIGMLATSAIVEAVAAAITGLELPNVVVDPVIMATSGARLLDDEGVGALCTELLPRARVVTPNVPEAEMLSGLSIQSLDDMRRAAQTIHERVRTAVIVKGGHRSGEELVDLLFDGVAFTEIRTPRVRAASRHGTGCTHASAVASQLAMGQSLAEAARLAQAYVAGAIRDGMHVGKGREPLDHFWTMRAREGSGSPDGILDM
jgi:hydroxymethylpyrimidine/phosphomethylpyrimidine kinase